MASRFHYACGCYECGEDYYPCNTHTNDPLVITECPHSVECCGPEGEPVTGLCPECTMKVVKLLGLWKPESLVDPTQQEPSNPLCPDCNYWKKFNADCHTCYGEGHAPLSVYIIGALRNPHIIDITNRLTREGFDPFSSWYSAGPDADDYLRDFERARGMRYQQILSGYAAQHIYQFDLFHLNRCQAGVLVLPAGKSCHLEMGYLRGQGKPCFILMEGEEPERVEVMHNFATKVCSSLEELVKELRTI